MMRHIGALSIYNSLSVFVLYDIDAITLYILGTIIPISSSITVSNSILLGSIFKFLFVRIS